LFDVSALSVCVQTETGNGVLTNPISKSIRTNHRLLLAVVLANHESITTITL